MDNIIWFSLLIPLYIIYEIYRIISISIFLYRNNRGGLAIGHPKHYADRLMEIYIDNKKGIQVKYGLSKYSNINGVNFWTVWTTCEQADDALLKKGLVIKDHHNILNPDKVKILSRIGNYVIFRFCLFLSRRVYFDQSNFFTG
jgi:hypothetical protein